MDPGVQQQYQAMSDNQLLAEYEKLKDAKVDAAVAWDAVARAIAARSPLTEDQITERLEYVTDLLGDRGVTLPSTPVVSTVPSDDQMQMTVTEDTQFTPASAAPELTSHGEGVTVIDPIAHEEMQMRVDSSSGPSAADYERAGVFDESLITTAAGATVSYQAMSDNQLLAEYEKLTDAKADAAVGVGVGDRAIFSRSPLTEDQITERLGYITGLLRNRGIKLPGTPVVSTGPSDDQMQMTVTEDTQFTPAGTAPELTSEDEEAITEADPITHEEMQMTVTDSSAGTAVAEAERAGVFDESLLDTPRSVPTSSGGGVSGGPPRRVVLIAVVVVVLVGVILAIVVSSSGGSKSKTSNSSTPAGSASPAPSGSGAVAVTMTGGLAANSNGMTLTIRFVGQPGTHTAGISFTGPGLPARDTLDVPPGGLTKTYPGNPTCGNSWSVTLESYDGHPVQPNEHNTKSDFFGCPVAVTP